MLEGLFIGDHVAADNKYILSRAGITHILTVGAGLYPKFPQKFTYKWISEIDSPTTNLKQHFAVCYQFISNVVDNGGRVLVHCYAGISRSATVIISYLMRAHELSLPEATSYLRSKRWFIQPNPGFIKQLQQYQKEIRSKDRFIAKIDNRYDPKSMMISPKQLPNTNDRLPSIGKNGQLSMDAHVSPSTIKKKQPLQPLLSWQNATYSNVTSSKVDQCTINAKTGSKKQLLVMSMTPIQSQPNTAKNHKRMASTGQNFITREPPLLLFNRENVKKEE